MFPLAHLRGFIPWKITSFGPRCKSITTSKYRQLRSWLLIWTLFNISNVRLCHPYFRSLNLTSEDTVSKLASCPNSELWLQSIWCCKQLVSCARCWLYTHGQLSNLSQQSQLSVQSMWIRSSPQSQYHQMLYSALKPLILLELAHRSDSSLARERNAFWKWVHLSWPFLIPIGLPLCCLFEEDWNSWF